MCASFSIFAHIGAFFIIPTIASGTPTASTMNTDTASSRRSAASISAIRFVKSAGIGGRDASTMNGGSKSTWATIFAPSALAASSARTAPDELPNRLAEPPH